MIKRISAAILITIMLFTTVGAVLLSAEAAGQTLTAEGIDAYIAAQMEKGHIPGLALGVVKGDSVVYLKSYGEAAPGRAVSENTPFALGSVSKMFTSLAIRQLISEGKLKEREAIRDYLPEFKPTYEGREAEITVFDLLAHTSGIPAASGGAPYLYNPRYTMSELVKKAAHTRLNRPVDSSYEYSNLNYLLLGLIIERVTHQPYRDYIQVHILDRLGMTHTYLKEQDAEKAGLAEGHSILLGVSHTVRYPIPQGFLPTGGVLSSTGDMTRFLRCFLNEGYYEGRSVIPDNPLPLPQGAEAAPNEKLWYNIFWLVNSGDENTNLRHEGSLPNYASSLRVNRQARYGIVVLANSFDQTAFYSPSITPWSISEGVMSYLETGSFPQQVPVRGSYGRLLPWLFPLALLVLYAVYTIRRVRRSFKVRVISLPVDFALPLLWVLLVPSINDSSWAWLLASNPEQNNLLLGLMALLPVVGIIKTVVYVRRNSPNRRVSTPKP